MDFTLTEEQRAIRDLAREFAQREIAPCAAEWDRTREFPAEVYRKLGAAGLMGLPFPEEYGGGGADPISLALAVLYVWKCGWQAVMTTSRSSRLIPE